MANPDQLTLAFLETLRRRCPDHVPLLEALGDLYTKAARYQEGLEIDLLLVGRDPGNGTYWYNLACSYSRLMDPESCLDALRKAVANGYNDYAWMMKDEDLAGVRKHPGFRQLVANLKKS